MFAVLDALLNILLVRFSVKFFDCQSYTENTLILRFYTEGYSWISRVPCEKTGFIENICH